MDWKNMPPLHKAATVVACIAVILVVVSKLETIPNFV